MVTQEELSRAFQEVGEKYGYNNVTAEFANFTHLKVRWTRSYKTAEFRVSDYLLDADVKVLEDLANTLYSRIAGSNCQYAESMRDWALNPEFSKNKRPVYLRRSRNLTRTSIGTTRNLQDSLTRLEEAGFIEKDSNVEVVWSTNKNSRRAGGCSVLMRLISISDELDSQDVPDYLVDYAVYCQYLRIIHGARTFGVSDDINTRDDERKYPRYREAENLLDKMCLFI